MGTDPTPSPVHDQPTAKMRIAIHPRETTDEDAPSSSSAGLITQMSARARDFRDAIADETPEDGVKPIPRAASAEKQKSPRRRRPGWVAVITAAIAAGPGWGGVERWIEDATGPADKASAGEVGEIRGELRAITGADGRLAALERRQALLDARQHDSDWRGVEEYKVIGDSLAQIAGVLEIPESSRPALNAEIVEQHAAIRDEHRARARAARDAKLLEQSEAAAARDTMAPP